ncbi:TPA: ABC transporter ATP-binding protein [Streptococcus suis]
MLTISNVRKKYGETLVLKDVSMSIKPGEIVGFVGANGAGKTTLIKSILGLHDIDSGEITFNGQKGFQKDAEVMNQIGYLLDTELFDYLTAREHIELMGLYEGRQHTNQEIQDILTRVALKDEKKVIKAYSYGMKQRLRLALAMVRRRKLLILDEPLLGLDISTIQEFKSYLKEIASTGVAILLSSHQLSEIEDLINRYLVLDGGEIKREVDGGQLVYKLNLGLDESQLEVFVSNLNRQVKSEIRIQDTDLYIPSQEVLNQVLRKAYAQNLDVKIEQMNLINQLFLEKGV